MSTMALVEGPSGLVAAWDTDGQIYFATITPGTTEFTKPQSAPGQGNERKHPALACNARGETILDWTEGTCWEKGGALAGTGFVGGCRPSGWVSPRTWPPRMPPPARARLKPLGQ